MFPSRLKPFCATRGYGEDAAREIGRTLREARLACGEELADAAERLRIRPAYLEALEAGEFGRVPARAYLVGFTRAYAKHLGLDSDELARRAAASRGLDGAPGPARAHTAGPRLVGGGAVAVLLLAAGTYAAHHLASRAGQDVVRAPKPATGTARVGSGPSVDRVADAVPVRGSDGAVPTRAVPGRIDGAHAPSTAGSPDALAGGSRPIEAPVASTPPLTREPPPVPDDGGTTPDASDATTADLAPATTELASPLPPPAGRLEEVPTAFALDEDTASQDPPIVGDPETFPVRPRPVGEAAAPALAEADPGPPRAGGPLGGRRDEDGVANVRPAAPAGATGAEPREPAGAAALTVGAAHLPPIKAVTATGVRPAGAMPAPGAGRFAVLVASVRDRAAVAGEWRRLARLHPSLAGLEPQPPRVVEVSGKGTFHRVLGGSFGTAAEARAACDRLRAEGAGYCRPLPL